MNPSSSVRTSPSQIADTKNYIVEIYMQNYVEIIIGNNTTADSATISSFWILLVQ